MNAIKNNVQLIGHLGMTPELKTFEGGKKLTRFTLATNEYYKDKAGNQQSSTQWHTVVAWGPVAELFSKITEKGNEIALQGKLSYNSYTDKNGVERKNAEIVASEFMKIGKDSK